MAGKRAAFIATALPACALLASMAASSAPAQGPAASEARRFVDSLYRIHFKAGQGFSVSTLRASRGWFTPTLYRLMLRDMQGSEIGYLDADPFTDAQDDAASFAVGQASSSHDTLYVDVTNNFGPDYRPQDRVGHVKIAVLRVGQRLRIADFILRSGSLAAGLRRSRS